MLYMGTIKSHIPLLSPLITTATHCAYHIKTKHQENYHAHIIFSYSFANIQTF